MKRLSEREMADAVELARQKVENWAEENSHYTLPHKAVLQMAAEPPAETLALIAEHRLTLQPAATGWLVTKFGADRSILQQEDGPTIGDAVRACVARMKERP
jgi:hypothetical protein